MNVKDVSKKIVIILSIMGLLFLLDSLLGILFFSIGKTIRDLTNSAELSLFVRLYFPTILSATMLSAIYFILKIDSLNCLLIAISLFICVSLVSLGNIALRVTMEYIVVLVALLLIVFFMYRWFNYKRYRPNTRRLKVAFVLTGLVFVVIFIYISFSPLLYKHYNIDVSVFHSERPFGVIQCDSWPLGKECVNYLAIQYKDEKNIVNSIIYVTNDGEEKFVLDSDIKSLPKSQDDMIKNHLFLIVSENYNMDNIEKDVLKEASVVKFPDSVIKLAGRMNGYLVFCDANGNLIHENNINFVKN
ncbi:MAG: hypothetical protein K8R02_06925 [Anaerohalosphaeraceae bacterium]|nr:hypothetical protein [Anaerohalosphaeraceae bacterium]